MSISIFVLRLFHWWSHTPVFVPYPVEEVLVTMYGEDYRSPDQDWQWDISPFQTGYCHHSLTLYILNQGK